MTPSTMRPRLKVSTPSEKVMIGMRFRLIPSCTTVRKCKITAGVITYRAAFLTCRFLVNRSYDKRERLMKYKSNMISCKRNSNSIISTCLSQSKLFFTCLKFFNILLFRLGTLTLNFLFYMKHCFNIF